VAPFEDDVHVEACAERLRGQRVIQRTGGQDSPVSQEQQAVETRRDLVDVVRDEDGGGCRRVRGESGEAADEILATVEIEASGRLVEQQ
jgi:hypothetical protein